LKERVNAYVQHIVSQKKWLDAVENKYAQEKQGMFERYKGECNSLYKENRKEWRPVMEQEYRDLSKRPRLLPGSRRPSGTVRKTFLLRIR